MEVSSKLTQAQTLLASGRCTPAFAVLLQADTLLKQARKLGKHGEALAYENRNHAGIDAGLPNAPAIGVPLVCNRTIMGLPVAIQHLSPCPPTPRIGPSND
jgi:hypothetical protein